MYRGYNLDLNCDEEYFELGNELNEINTQKARISLIKYLSNDSELNGSLMEEDWFPQVNVDIFISHSHSDERKCKSFAGWLYKTFNLTSFIDSCIWNNATDLLSAIDKKHATIPGKELFNYEKRNQTTAHVYCMLSMALMKMIDKTECFFLFNSPNSIKISDSVSKTKSPWIYSELIISQLVKNKPIKRHDLRISKGIISTAKSILYEDIDINYDANINHLTKIDIDKINEWSRKHKNNSYALDTLYHLT
ncbi:hypothetical protein CH369_18275 [Leptospira levettii]|uniref:hypothetical protein n=1 Tax=Leptospira levettii TaxID=2023178 RepID=UPI000C2985E2|nr:hypothetical protein [Leptospira levettii]MCW7475632.1 hypothetical protein [Leptospira levettii]PJZ86842.1 hypothetical protein CH368_19930 [Leptospira levettii]PJZ98813.1 hypothetical protein CH369_18275 [Leptospira levettii]